MTRFSKLASFPVLGLLLTMPKAFAGAPQYSLSIVAQTGSVIGGYTVGNLVNAALNDSGQVVFSATVTQGTGPQLRGYLSSSQLLGSSTLSLPWFNFFLDNHGKVYIDTGGAVYAFPVDLSAPPSLIFNDTPMPGASPCPSAPPTTVFGVDDSGGIGLLQNCSPGFIFLGTQNGVLSAFSAYPTAPVMSHNEQIAYLDPTGFLRTSGGLRIGPGSVLGGTQIAGIAGTPGVSNNGQVAFAATAAGVGSGVFTGAGLAFSRASILLRRGVL